LMDALLWSMAAATLGAILILSLRTQPPLPAFVLADKVGHFAAYSVLTAAVLLAAVWRPRRGLGPFPGSARAITLTVIALGALLELAQSFVGRDASMWDAAADALGVAAAYGSWRLVRGGHGVRPRRPGPAPDLSRR
jgi:VanZ family protein